MSTCKILRFPLAAEAEGDRFNTLIVDDPFNYPERYVGAEWTALRRRVGVPEPTIEAIAEWAHVRARSRKLVEALWPEPAEQI